MTQPIQAPTKEQIRAYMQERQAANTPPKTPDEIRRELGWLLLPHNDSITR